MAALGKPPSFISFVVRKVDVSDNGSCLPPIEGGVHATRSERVLELKHFNYADSMTDPQKLSVATDLMMKTIEMALGKNLSLQVMAYEDHAFYFQFGMMPMSRYRTRYIHDPDDYMKLSNRLVTELDNDDFIGSELHDRVSFVLNKVFGLSLCDISKDKIKVLWDFEEVPTEEIDIFEEIADEALNAEEEGRCPNYTCIGMNRLELTAEARKNWAARFAKV